MQLLQWARKAGAWIFEDDYDSEYRFVGRPLPALQGLAPESAVIFAGSFNKLLFPALRLGYVALPQALVEPFCRARSVTDRFPPVLDQAALCDFINEGYFGQHLRRMREAYSERLDALVNAAKPLASLGFQLHKIQAGMQTAALLPRSLPDLEVTELVKEVEISALPLSIFQIKRDDINGLLLGFAGVTPSEIRRGAKVLETVLRRFRKSRSR
jgi:GntR family transcriptional regulator/MocR family aminotransferase